MESALPGRPEPSALQQANCKPPLSGAALVFFWQCALACAFALLKGLFQILQGGTLITRLAGLATILLTACLLLPCMTALASRRNATRLLCRLACAVQILLSLIVLIYLFPDILKGVSPPLPVYALIISAAWFLYFRHSLRFYGVFPYGPRPIFALPPAGTALMRVFALFSLADLATAFLQDAVPVNDSLAAAGFVFFKGAFPLAVFLATRRGTSPVPIFVIMALWCFAPFAAPLLEMAGLQLTLLAHDVLGSNGRSMLTGFVCLLYGLRIMASREERLWFAPPQASDVVIQPGLPQYHPGEMSKTGASSSIRAHFHPETFVSWSFAPGPRTTALVTLGLLALPELLPFHAMQFIVPERIQGLVLPLMVLCLFGAAWHSEWAKAQTGKRLFTVFFTILALLGTVRSFAYCLLMLQTFPGSDGGISPGAIIGLNIPGLLVIAFCAALTARQLSPEDTWRTPGVRTRMVNLALIVFILKQLVLWIPLLAVPFSDAQGRAGFRLFDPALLDMGSWSTPTTSQLVALLLSLGYYAVTLVFPAIALVLIGKKTLGGKSGRAVLGLWLGLMVVTGQGVWLYYWHMLPQWPLIGNPGESWFGSVFGYGITVLLFALGYFRHEALGVKTSERITLPAPDFLHPPQRNR